MLNKRAVELTLGTVVIAVLVIIVLIVLLVIFNKGTGGFLSTTTDCSARKGTCMGDAESCTRTGGEVYGMGKCSSGVCCIPAENILSDQNAQP